MPPPNTCAKVVTAVGEVPGVDTGAVWEITSVRPSSVKSIPNVAMNEEMPMTATKNPLTRPINVLPSNDTITAGTSGTPAVASL